MRRSSALVLVLFAVALSLVPGEGMTEPGAAWADVCGPVPEGYARCFAKVRTDAGTVTPSASFTPAGYSPQQIKKAYKFPTDPDAGEGETIAIVTAFDAPTIEADLAVFSKQFKLPQCTTSNGCFAKVDRKGGTNFPPADAEWALEASLDVQWAHAIAPGARILLVEATTNSIVDLLSAFQYATQHAAYVSNSWGRSDFSLPAANFLFVIPGVSDFFASGDNGGERSWPATHPDVIAVGGTSLDVTKKGKLRSETGWSGTGGGCSAFHGAGPVQSAFGQYPGVGCAGKRATPDVALVGDPATGVAVYDSTPVDGVSGWFVSGGTSASCPMIAGRAAVTGDVVDASYIYGMEIRFRDITAGNNGFPAGPGYDLVTGRGSWTR